jgi:cytochrome c oxidase subunit 3
MPAEAAVLQDQFDDLEQQRKADTLGMWLFLATEVLIFGGLIAGYFAYRCWYSHDFEAVSGKLNVLIGGVNTLVLLTSSLTMALSVHFARGGRREALTLCLVLTALLGTAFMVLKGVEYYSDYRDGLVPRTERFRPEEWTRMDPPVSPARVELFLMFYYVMTGLHAVHLTVGIGLVLWLAVRAWRGGIPAGRYMDVDITGLYWHFVDVVWIFLLPLLYLIGTHSLSDVHFL